MARLHIEKSYTDVYTELEERFREAALYRPMRIQRHEPGTELTCEAAGVSSPSRARIRLRVEEFIGGGFAGQVYKTSLLDISPIVGTIEGLKTGGTYAVKILVPPTVFSRIFRNILYRIGFQGPFQLQCNPYAARAGALWQKFIRRAAGIRFGSERTVVDIHATLIDSSLGSCGEVSEWVEGRTWQLEVDSRMDSLRRWERGRAVDEARLGSPEYRAKKEFMKTFVEMLHEIGAHEFARQYEWGTWKSQPNCLKRSDTRSLPAPGLTAVDFRAGLVLLPFLPMSPGDFSLIVKGLRRGSLVQFDRGSLERLESFVAENAGRFADMGSMLEELKSADRIYRESVPDVTHHRLRLFHSGRLWSTILDGSVTGWKVRNLLDDTFAEALRRSRLRRMIFMLLGIVPFAGTAARRFWGYSSWRSHYRACLSQAGYLRRALLGRIAERLIVWHREERVSDERAMSIASSGPLYYANLPLAILPAGLHRFLSDPSYARKRLDYLLLRPVRLYFDAETREQWLRDMVREGRMKRLLSGDDEKNILSRIGEPFVQKYLKCLAVHVCTVPITQVVSISVAALYVMMHPEMPRAQAYAVGLAIIALFQVLPISPGSLVRGTYVLYLVVRERNFRDYNIAVFLGFFKYIGYLAFPIQMAYRYPVLARFMAGYWATGAVHVIPVFGEHGALLEHKVFGLFYNWPLTIRRRMNARAARRASRPPRYWHLPLVIAGATGVFAAADVTLLFFTTTIPRLRDIWWLVIAVPLATGAIATLGAGGLSLGRRVISGAFAGALTGLLYAVTSTLVGPLDSGAGTIVSVFLWRVFLFTVLAVVGVFVTELTLPEPSPASISQTVSPREP